MEVSSVHSPGWSLCGPPPIMSVTGLNVPGLMNSTVAPRASPTARPRSAPRARSAVVSVVVIGRTHALWRRWYRCHSCRSPRVRWPPPDRARDARSVARLPRFRGACARTASFTAGMRHAVAPEKAGNPTQTHDTESSRKALGFPIPSRAVRVDPGEEMGRHVRARRSERRNSDRVACRPANLRSVK